MSPDKWQSHCCSKESGVSETFVDLLSHEFPLVFVYKLNEVQAHIDIVGNATINGYALMSRYATNLPRFSDIRLGGVDFLEWCYLISSPDGGFQIRFKFVRFHACILFRFFFIKIRIKQVIYLHSRVNQFP